MCACLRTGLLLNYLFVIVGCYIVVLNPWLVAGLLFVDGLWLLGWWRLVEGQRLAG